MAHLMNTYEFQLTLTWPSFTFLVDFPCYGKVAYIIMNYGLIPGTGEIIILFEQYLTNTRFFSNIVVVHIELSMISQQVLWTAII